MGNSHNNNSKPQSICETLDNISSNYILSMDYRALSHMSDEEYCNKFTLITQDLLDKKFNKLDIKYLTIRIKKGHKPLIDIFNRSDSDIPTYETVTKKDEVYYSDDITNDNKKQMCLNISRFYIKIGHLFAAIVTALDPVYIVDGQPYPFNTPKNKLPEHTVLTISETGICHKKIMALQFGYLPENKLNPRFCNIHNKFSNLYNYNGIPELENLYYDKIDANGKPYMSETSRNQYSADLQLMYSQFSPQSTPTGDQSVPNTDTNTTDSSESPESPESQESANTNNDTSTTPQSQSSSSSSSSNTTEINNFKDISLKEYHNNINCNDNTFNTPITKSEKDNVLFIDYADNLKEMLSFSKKKETFFLNVINEIFIQSPNKSIIINPQLTDNRLDQLINEVRNNLLEYYIKIDEYFNNGVDIYTAIVLYRKLHKQLDNINEINSNVPENTNEYDNLSTPTAPYTMPNSNHLPPDMDDHEDEHEHNVEEEDENTHRSTETPSSNTDFEKDNNNSPYKPLFNTNTPTTQNTPSTPTETETQEHLSALEPEEPPKEEIDEEEPEKEDEDPRDVPDEYDEIPEHEDERERTQIQQPVEQPPEQPQQQPVEQIQQPLQQPVEQIQQQLQQPPVQPQPQPQQPQIIIQPQPIIINQQPPPPQPQQQV